MGTLVRWPATVATKDTTTPSANAQITTSSPHAARATTAEGVEALTGARVDCNDDD